MNGSGGGGATFTLAPKEADAIIRTVVRSVERAGSRAEPRVTLGSGAYSERPLDWRLRPSAFSGGELLTNLLPLAKGRASAEAAAIAQRLLECGAIRPEKGSAGKTDGETFAEDAMYVAGLFSEMSRARAQLLLDLLRIKSDVCDHKLRGEVIKDSFYGAAAIDAWTDGEDAPAQSRAHAVLLGQELMNKGFIYPANRERVDFRDSKELYYVGQGLEHYYWGYALKQSQKFATWKLRWFVCRNLQDKRIYFFRSPSGIKPRGFIPFDDAVVAFSPKSMTCDILTPARLWKLHFLSPTTQDSWVAVIDALSKRVVADNDTVDTAEFNIVSHKACNSKDWLLKLLRIVPETETVYAEDEVDIEDEPVDGTQPVEMPVDDFDLDVIPEDEPPDADDSLSVRMTNTTVPFRFRDIPSCLLEDRFPCLVRAAVPHGTKATALMFDQTLELLWVGFSHGAVASIPLSFFPPGGRGTFTEMRSLQVENCPTSSVVSLVEIHGTTIVWAGHQNGDISVWSGRPDGAPELLSVIRRNAKLPALLTTFSKTVGFSLVSHVSNIYNTGFCRAVFCTGPSLGKIEILYASPDGCAIDKMDKIRIEECATPITSMKLAPDGFLWVVAGLNLYVVDAGSPMEHKPYRKVLTCIDQNNPHEMGLKTTCCSQNQGDPPFAYQPAQITFMQPVGLHQMWTGHESGELCLWNFWPLFSLPDAEQTNEDEADEEDEEEEAVDTFLEFSTKLRDYFFGEAYFTTICSGHRVCVATDSYDGHLFTMSTPITARERARTTNSASRSSPRASARRMRSPSNAAALPAPNVDFLRSVRSSFQDAGATPAVRTEKVAALHIPKAEMLEWSDVGTMPVRRLILREQPVNLVSNTQGNLLGFVSEADHIYAYNIATELIPIL